MHSIELRIMLKTDLSDVTGYTFLMNGQTPEKNWTASFKQGEKIRLRMINASAMSFFDVRIPNLKMTVVAADGQPVKPVQIDEFRFGAGETYDVIVEPKEEEIHKERNLVVNTLEIEDLPSQLPKIEQNQLPADCGHPLKTARNTSSKQVSYQIHIESAVGEIEGIRLVHDHCILLGQLRRY